MSQPATLPPHVHSTEEQHAPEATAQLLMQNLEDQYLADRIERALHARGYWAMHAVQVTVRARVVLLGGRVCSYYLKQLAQVTALAVPGAHQIRNDLDVVPQKHHHATSVNRRTKSAAAIVKPHSDEFDKNKVQ